MRNDTKARAFTKAAKMAIAQRDEFDCWPCCIYCGKPAPSYLGYSNAHYIGRAQGGLGIPENGLTLCPECHRRYDQTTEREPMRAYFRDYLMQNYPDWDEQKLYWRKNQC